MTPDPISSIHIDLDALAHNMQAIRRHIGPEVAIFSVVKANAYGHGAVGCARAALAAGAAALCVVRLEEAIELRKAGITAPILNISYAHAGEMEAALRWDITATPIHFETAQALSAQAEASGRRARVHVKVDTGLGRYGLLPEETLPFLNSLRGLPGLEVEGIFTHFATSDEADQTYARQQLASFQEVLAAASAAGHRFRYRHAANSAGTLYLPDAHFDAVRPGLITYGMCPSTELPCPIDLRPILTLKSRLARVRTLPAGASIGYGRSYITKEPTQVGLVIIGYGDGYRRALGNKAEVLVAGQRVPMIGRVSMDHIVVNLNTVPQAREGDEVILIGQQGKASLTADDVAAWLGTINYEVTTGLLPRLPRLYYQGGQHVDSAFLAGGSAAD